jgi:hypothetical protein
MTSFNVMTEYGSLPVELLRDERGVYGIGVSELFDYEAIAWSCGIEPEPWDFERPSALILRPDFFVNTKALVGRDYAVLQKIAGGFRRGPFMHSREERLRQFIHHEALKRAGLPWPPPDNDHVRWWTADKKQQSRNQLRGPCNAEPPKAVTLAVQRWLRAQEPLPGMNPEIAGKVAA